MSGLHAVIARKLGAFSLDINLVVRDSVMALFGRSGAGKTQTLECIAGLVRPDRGEIILDGETLFRKVEGQRSVERRARLRRMGYVFQDGLLFPHQTVLGNVVFASKLAGGGEAAAKELLEELGIAHLSQHTPLQLSGGQRRRAAIARALASRPRMLLLDEPFVHLDRIAHDRLVADVLRTVRDRRIPALLVTHELRTLVRAAQRVAVVHDGRVVQEGLTDEVLRRPATSGVARLLGDVNLIAGVVVGQHDGWWDIETGQAHWRVAHSGPLAMGDEVEVLVRSGAVKILRPGREVPSELAVHAHRARLIEVERMPGTVWATFELEAGVRLVAEVAEDRFDRAMVQENDHCEIAVAPDGITLFTEVSSSFDPT